MSRIIRISQDTYDHLKEHAEPFVDTPDSVIRRLLGLATQESSSVDDGTAATQVVVAAGPHAVSADPSRQAVAVDGSAKRHRSPGTARASRPRRNAENRVPRAPRGSLLAEDAYEIPMLQVLADHGGRAGKNEVLDALESQLADQLTELDRAPIASGEVRWRNRAQFVRLRLVERGEIKRNSPRGIWELSDAGDTRLHEANSDSLTTGT